MSGRGINSGWPNSDDGACSYRFPRSGTEAEFVVAHVQRERAGPCATAPAMHPAILRACVTQNSAAPYPAITAATPPSWNRHMSKYNPVAKTPTNRPWAKYYG